MEKNVIFVLSEENHGDVGYYTDATMAIADFLKIAEQYEGKLVIDYDNEDNVVRMNLSDLVDLRQQRLNYCSLVGRE